jgi:DNA-binding transcriptional LysR family regulator
MIRKPCSPCNLRAANCFIIKRQPTPTVVNIHHLELFYYVARHQGVSAAARHIPYGIQQPAISAQVLQLESNLGVTLFQRRPFQLTREGAALYSHIEPFFSGLPELQSRISGGAHERLRIAAPELVQREYLPPLLGRIRLNLPRFHFSLTEARQDQIENLLVAQEIDVGLAVQTSKPSASLQATPIRHLHMTLLVPEKFDIDSAAQLFASDRIAAPLITLAGSDTVRRAFLEELRNRQIEWLPSLELSSLDLVARYAAQGFGIGLSVKLARIRLPKGVIEIPLEGFPPVTFSVFHQPRTTPLVDTFISECRLLAEELFGPA